MLNFLLDRSPSSKKQTTRQTTLDAMFSHLKSRSTPKPSSSPPSLTNASSVTDHSSETSDDQTQNSTFSQSTVTITQTSLTTTTISRKARPKMGAGQSKRGSVGRGQLLQPTVPQDTSNSPQASQSGDERAPATTGQRSCSTFEDAKTGAGLTPKPANPTPSPGVKPASHNLASTPQVSGTTPSPTIRSDSQNITSTPALSNTTSFSTPEDGPPDTESASRPSTPTDFAESGLSKAVANPQTPVAAKTVQPSSKAISSSATKTKGKRTHKEIDNDAEQSSPRKSPRQSIRTAKSFAASGVTDQETKVSVSKSRSRSKTTVKTSTSKSTSLATAFPKKLYLDKGLYAGQKSDFDARYTTAQNELRGKDGEKKPKERKFLPLPMYAGRRLIEEGQDFQLPFDIFSPLNARQPQPEKWGKLQKNIYVGDATKASKIKKHQEESRCVCTEEDECGEGCLNRDMHLECDSTNCKIGADLCKNRSFADLKARLNKAAAASKHVESYFVGVEVCQTPGRGFGLHACRSFNKDQIIVEYTGEIITKNEASRRLGEEYKNQQHHYMMEFHGGYILDGTRGSIARFVNHSCSPNCRIEKQTVEGKHRMALFAERDILTGEELTYDYNFEPFNEKSKQVCMCRSANCRGFLMPKPKETKDIKEPKEALQPITNKKRKLADTLASIADAVVPASKRQKATPKSMKAKAAKAPAEKEYVLPKGWVYREGPKPQKRIFEEDPEDIIKANKRAKKEAETPSSPAKRKSDAPSTVQNTTATVAAKATTTAKTVAKQVKKATKSLAGSKKR